jgi:hypothetical protein
MKTDAGKLRNTMFGTAWQCVPGGSWFKAVPAKISTRSYLKSKLKAQ